MSRARTPRLRLTAAVAVAVAATASGVLAAPATAAPAAMAAAPVTALPAAAQDVAPFPKEGKLVSAGKTGFLYKTGVAEAPFAWRGYDGTVTPLTGGGYVGAAGSDTIAQDGPDDTVVLRDMGSGAEPVVMKGAGTLLGVSGSTLVMRDANGAYLLDKAGDQDVRRDVAGLPADATDFRTPIGAETFTVSNLTSTLYLVDVAAAKVIATAAADNSILGFGAVAGSKTHLAWYDWTPADDGGNFHILDVATDEARIVPEGNSVSEPVLSKEWMAFLTGSAPAGKGRPLGLHPLAGGQTQYVLDRADEVRLGADGSFLVKGALAREEGVYRVTVGADGKPAAELVASSGRLPDLALVSQEVPETFTLDEPYGYQEFDWTFNRPVAGTLKLVHTATGREYTRYGSDPTPPLSILLSNTDVNNMGLYGGAYTWKLTATELYDVGPSVELSGAFTVNRPAAARDHDENGVADVLVRDAEGTLKAYDTNQLQRIYEEWNRPLEPTVLGTGWNTYTLMASPSERTVVGRDRDGVLWIHKGQGQKLLPRTKVGGGWQIYNKITGGSDLNGDGRGDLLARDTAGVLWFYASTGDTATPFKPRVQIGGGWQQYNLLTAPGNIAGATGGDLLARDTNGVLWLYLGKGDGTFTARRQIGGGWQQFTDLAPFGDKNKDGLVDLYAIGAAEGRHYATSGLVDAPFKPGVTLHHQRTVLGSGTVF
ncbi:MULTISPECIES: hypothetical protein [unclassified Streptomyces]|uniref:hypothetical protein n=1 Tax=unclassified Streptomyces TaxID=2593676 RepID=UPI0036F5654E